MLEVFFGDLAGVLLIPLAWSVVTGIVVWFNSSTLNSYKYLGPWNQNTLIYYLVFLIHSSLVPWHLNITCIVCQIQNILRFNFLCLFFWVWQISKVLIPGQYELWYEKQTHVIVAQETACVIWISFCAWSQRQSRRITISIWWDYLHSKLSIGTLCQQKILIFVFIYTTLMP